MGLFSALSVWMILAPTCWAKTIPCTFMARAIPWRRWLRTTPVRPVYSLSGSPWGTHRLLAPTHRSPSKAMKWAPALNPGARSERSSNFSNVCCASEA